MKTKVLLGLAAILIPVFLLVTTHKNAKNRPSDLRDAPKDYSDGAIGSLNPSDIPVPQLRHSSNVPNRSIIGENTMTDYYKVNRSLQELADSTVALVKKSSLCYDKKTKRYKALKSIIGERQHYSSGTDFYGQAVLSFCSGALVSPHMILTAGHCVSPDPEAEYLYFKNFYVVFGWKAENENTFPDSFDAKDVYTVRKIYAKEQSNLMAASFRIEDNILNKYMDYALLLLDRPVYDKEPLAIDRTGTLPVRKAKVFTIGYPKGMSVKITDPEEAGIHKSGDNMIYTDIDCFGGNSGGPVFDAHTRRIIGILVTGDVRENEIVLNTSVEIPYKVVETGEAINFSIRKALLPDKNGVLVTGLEIPRIIYNQLREDDKVNHLFYDTQKVVFIDRDAKIYNNSLEYELLSIVGFKEYQAKPAKFKYLEDFMRGAGVQRILPQIERLVPLTDNEKGAVRQ